MSERGELTIEHSEPASPATAERSEQGGRVSLRARLVVVVVLLLALATAVIGAGTAVAMRGFLLGRLDEELFAFTRVAARFPSPGVLRDERLVPARELLGPARPGSVTAVVRGGVVEAAWVVDLRGEVTAVPTPELDALLGVPLGATPTSVALGSLGTHRAVAVAATGGATAVTALSEQPVQDAVTRLVALELGIGLVVLVGAGVAGAVLVRRELRPLSRVAATATRVAALPLDRGEVSLAERVPGTDLADPATEVGQVGTAFNRMLDHVDAALRARQESETRLRRFVADASHELRTPLAAIRGYAELLGRDPDPPRAVGRITASAQRMSGLVEDLLLLARLDAGRPLERAPVDLTRLVVDAVGDAHVAGPAHRFRLDLPPEPVVVPGDAARLAQVLANLLANARTHTPPGTTVGVTLNPENGAARLTVADDGPGIAPDVLPHVFERFARGAAGRSREHGSTGLGLAIVDAVVVAHGGTVTAESRPGRTVLMVTLPRRAL